MSKTFKQTIHETLGRHPVHPFPARMAPGIALDVLEAEERKIRVLDPMMGSGTVLAVARERGHRAFGVDIDPLAVLLARVWTTSIDPIKVKAEAELVLRRSKSAFLSCRSGDAYPSGADEETRRFIRYWFDIYARRQLASLAEAISEVEDCHARESLWCAFSRLIITKQAGASLALDLSHSRPHKAFQQAPVKPFNKFLSAVEYVLRNSLTTTRSNRGPATNVSLGDARSLPIGSGTIDLVLTSPPYLNAIDYIRCSKFSLVWMGHSVNGLGDIRTKSVGSETSDDAAEGDTEIQSIISELKLKPKLSPRHQGILAHYVYDMRNSMRETARVLSSGGKAVYVVGENTVRGTFIPNAKMIVAIAERLGLSTEGRRARALPSDRRYLPPPTVRSSADALNGRMRREVILTFAK